MPVMQREIEESWRCLSVLVSKEDQKRILELVDMQAANAGGNFLSGTLQP